MWDHKIILSSVIVCVLSIQCFGDSSTQLTVTNRQYKMPTIIGVDYYEATAYCFQFNMALLEIGSEQDMVDFQKNSGHNILNDYWLGFTRVGISQSYYRSDSDGSRLQYFSRWHNDTKWTTGQSTNGCVLMNVKSENYTFLNYACTEKYHVMCYRDIKSIQTKFKNISESTLVLNKPDKNPAFALLLSILLLNVVSIAVIIIMFVRFVKKNVHSNGGETYNLPTY